MNKQRIDDLKKKATEISKSISKPIIKITAHSINGILYQNFNDWMFNLKESIPNVVFETIIIDTKKFEYETLVSRVILKDWLDDPEIISEDDGTFPFCLVFPKINDLEIINGAEYGFLSGGFFHNVRFYPWEDKKEEIEQKISFLILRFFINFCGSCLNYARYLEFFLRQ